jgi:hypothetical protein
MKEFKASQVEFQEAKKEFKANQNEFTALQVNSAHSSKIFHNPS